MAPPTNLEKAENEWKSLACTLKTFEAELARHATNNLTLVEVNYWLEELQTHRKTHTEIHLKILNCAPADMDPYNLTYTSMLMEISKLVCSFQKLKADLKASANASGSNPNNNSGSSSTSADIKLPRIELPSFNGDLNTWMSFKDQFTAAVHINDKITNAQKLTYLKSTLKGEAAKLVTSMATTDSNYDIAWKSLEERYQNERELVFSFLKRFFGQTVSQGESATSLRNLIDVSKECIRSLAALSQPVEHWDVIIVYTMLQKSAPKTRQEWELTQKSSSVPNLEEFLDFLEQRARALAAGGITKSTHHAKPDNNAKAAGNQRVFAHHASKAACFFCGEEHSIYKCATFLAMTNMDRRKAAKKKSLCFNCLRPKHDVEKCTSTWSCKICKERHNTLLHVSTGNPTDGNSVPNVTVHHSNESFAEGQGFLATALVKVNDVNNRQQLCRVLLDSGSTTSFITEGCTRRLGLELHNTQANVIGIAASNAGKAKKYGSFIMQSHLPTDGESFEFTALVLPRITMNIPAHPYHIDSWTHLDGLPLADPEYFKPAPIDILLGSDLFWDLLLNGRRKGQIGTPLAVESKLGWLVAGKANSGPSEILIHHSDLDLDNTLQKFWELESIPSCRIYTNEEQACEQHFVQTTERAQDGKFIVQFPFKNAEPCLGASRDIAIRRLKSLEKRLNGQPKYRVEYNEFMKEYLELGHMEEVSISPVSNPYYIPHHFVLKESSSTTKFRVVFDASAKSSSGVSLNDELMVGPTIQESLVNILVRFRTHTIAFTADIAKMYRQILIKPSQCDFQRIVWRNDPSEEIKDYRLLTVTYGTASAPFHATRVLQELAEQEKDTLRSAYNVARHDFYVDDLMSGAPTVEKALVLQKEIMELTRRGKLTLRKWTSNNEYLLSSLPPEFRETQLPLSMDKDELIKTLGLHWNAGLDTFTFKVNLNPIKPGVHTTKRMLLSEMSKVFDPLGWLAPIIIKAKIMFQQLWLLQVGWDEALPSSVAEQWKIFREELIHIESIIIPRNMHTDNAEKITLHGFSDASERAYSAVVYCCAKHEGSDKQHVTLIAAKTRVAPAKKITLPRLELCGAVLLTKIMTSVTDSLKLNIQQYFAWTDSTIVLDWLRAHPSKWKTFVANRVTEVQNCSNMIWGHVSGDENPADCASRGINPCELVNHPLWWKGPAWLEDPSIPPHSVHPESNPNDLQVKEEERKSIVFLTTATINELPLLRNCSTLRKLTRVTAWCQRFIFNCRIRMHSKGDNAHHKIKNPQLTLCRMGPLTASETEEALNHWLKDAQLMFKHEVHCLKKKIALPTASRLKTLNPYIDSNQFLRVGGRLRHAPIAMDQRNPIILPRHHKLTELIIRSEHEKTLHGGQQQVLAATRRRFWILGAKDAIRHQIKKCIICTRHRAELMQQPMGDLPKSRVTPTRPFLTTGVD